MCSIVLRSEIYADTGQVHELVKCAFGGRTGEPELVDLIRARGNARLATVAVDGGDVVGYVLASPLELVPKAPIGCLGIAPLAVLPERQGSGIGSLLMRHIVGLARDGGVDALFLLGSPAYYPRFGFAPTHIGNEYGASDAFMALELSDGCLADVRATAKYVAEFSELGV
jgi:putative acetyltransferase